jgi:hypothetical protein
VGKGTQSTLGKNPEFFASIKRTQNQNKKGFNALLFPDLVNTSMKKVVHLLM